MDGSRAGFVFRALLASACLAAAPAAENVILSPDGTVTRLKDDTGEARIIRSSGDSSIHDSKYWRAPSDRLGHLLGGAGSRAARAPAAPEGGLVAALIERFAYHAGFEGWDHSVAGYVTDYILAFVAFVCLGHTVMFKKFVPHLTQHFLLMLAFQAISFDMGGVAHHILDVQYQSGESMGRKWDGVNSEWMYPWLVGMVTAPIYAAASLAFVAFAFPMTSSVCTSEIVAAPPKGTKVITALAYIVGAFVSLYEGSVLYAENTKSTGAAGGLFSTVTATLCMIIIGMGLLMKGGRSKARILALVGAILKWLGFMVIMTKPKSCAETGDKRKGCPYPEGYNHNAVFHTFVILSIPFLTAAAWRKIDKCNVARGEEHQTTNAQQDRQQQVGQAQQ